MSHVILGGLLTKEIIITLEQIAMNSNLYPGQAKDKPWRAYIADRFKLEHGCIVVDFEKLRYLATDHGEAMEVRGEVGKSISAPVK